MFGKLTFANLMLGYLTFGELMLGNSTFRVEVVLQNSLNYIHTINDFN
jgi:hypothetical protein